MEVKMYVQLIESKESDYISIEQMILEEDMQKSYEDTVNILKNSGVDDSYIPTLDGFKRSYLLINVTYDGRKKKASESDVIKALVKEGYIQKVGKGGFMGGYYRKTDKLEVNEDLLAVKLLLPA